MNSPIFLINNYINNYPNLDDLRKEEWFSELPNDFKKLGENDYFSFFYYYDLENTKLQVNRTSILSRPNIYIYAGIKDSEENLGYFRQPFNTKDTLFYYFLSVPFNEIFVMVVKFI